MQSRRRTHGLQLAMIASLLWLGLGTFARSVEPDEILADRALETRARAISSGLRCLVCQNQSIDDSNAPLARDLRVLVRERLKAGDSDAAVVGYIVDRYGEFVLLRPRLSRETVLLWGAPFLLLAGALLVLWRSWRPVGGPSGAANPAMPPLTEAERARLEKLLQDRG